MCHSLLKVGYDPEDLAHVLRKLFAARLTYHDGTTELADGLSLHRVGAHTYGQQLLRVKTRQGWLVLASDALHFTEILTSGLPFPNLDHVGAALDGSQLLRKLADREELIIRGHDPAIMRRFPPANAAAEEIAVRLD